jgi:GNAT superfamily N-acetyltransferase
VTPDYQIQRYRPDLRGDVLRLQKHLWGPDLEFNDRYFAWKHEQNPYHREPRIYLALSGGKVVGMRSFFGTRWEAGIARETFDALYADDFAIVPEHRNRGLVSRIMDTALGDLASGSTRLLVNLSAGRVTLLASLAGGWKSAGPVRPIGRRASRAVPFSLARGLARRLPLVGPRAVRLLSRAAGATTPFSRIDRAAARRGGTLGPKVTLGQEARSDEMAALVSRLPYDGRIRHVRDAAYVSWRYRNPMSRYRFLFWDDRGLQGYLVLRTSPSEGRPPGRVSIADWEARDDAVRADLLSAALSHGRFLELVAWSAAVPGAARALLEHSGFAPVDAQKTAQGFPCILVRPIGGELPAADWSVAGRRLLEPADWDLRMVYSMHG